MTEYQKYVLSKKEKRRCVLVLSGLLLAASFLFYQNCLLVILLPVFTKKTWAVYETHCCEGRKKKLLTEFRDFLFSLSASFATGRHMTEAMKEAEGSLHQIYGNKGYLERELIWMMKAVEDTGQSVNLVFADFAARSGIEDIQLLSEVYNACRDTGGDMANAVNKAASILTDKINIEMEIETMLSQKKLEGTIIAIMPSAMILFLTFMSPDYLQPLYETISGRIVMTLALMVNVFAYLWMEKMTNVEL